MAATAPENDDRPIEQEPSDLAPEAGEAEVSAAGAVSVAAPAADAAPADAIAVDAPAAVEAPAPSVVFVEAPKPPRARGARGVGVVVALLGTGIFAAVYAGIVLLLASLTAPAGAPAALRFLALPTFWIPVIVFTLAYVLLVVIVNRAGWWAHVLGGFLVAVIVWAGFVGAAIITAGAFGAPAEVVALVVAEQLTNPIGFAAAIVAREVPIWVGWIVARRGRSARARNQAAREAYEQELADHRATVGGRTAV